MPTSINFIEMIGRGKIPDAVVGTWIVMGILILFGLAARWSLMRVEDPIVPDQGITLRSFSETMVEWLDGFVHDVTQVHHWREWVPFFGTLFIFILASNFFGLIPGMEPPTNDTDLTFGLGAICFVYYIYQGVRAQGGINYLKNDLVGPVWWLFFLMIPINFADNVFRPFSLGIRLSANMTADHTVLGIFTGLTRLVIPLAFYALGTIVCVIQALIFVVLAMSYVRLATAHEH